MSVRSLHITEALASYRRLGRIVHELSAEEVTACLELETASQRRRSVTDKLIRRAVQLNESTFIKALQEKYHG